VAPCSKVRYVDMASARAALARVRKKAKPGAKVPVACTCATYVRDGI
jgi:hypothetical protein